MSAKQLALEVIQGLPDSITFEEISQKMATMAEPMIEMINVGGLDDSELTPELRAKIERGEADIAAGRTHTHAEVKAMIAQWRTK